MAALSFLIVDETSFNRDLIKRQLRNQFMGSTVEEASGLGRAQTLIKQHHFDLILADWELPDETDGALLTWLRDAQELDEDVRKSAYIVISAQVNKEQVVKAVEAGTNDYLNKPFKPDELLTKINKQLKRIGKANHGSAGPSSGSSVADDMISALTTKKPSTSTATSSDTLGKANISFADGSHDKGLIKGKSADAITVMMKRGNKLPALFDHATADVELNNNPSLIRLDSFISGIKSADGSSNSQFILVSFSPLESDTNGKKQLAKL